MRPWLAATTVLQSARASAGVAWLAATTVLLARSHNCTLGCPSRGVILGGGVILGLRPRRRPVALHEQAGALVQAYVVREVRYPHGHIRLFTIAAGDGTSTVAIAYCRSRSLGSQPCLGSWRPAGSSSEAREAQLPQ